MFIDTRSGSPETTVSADVCVIGAGPAGITVALELMDAGLKLVLLESGGLEPDDETQVMARGGIIGSPYGPLESTRYRAFGGTAHGWGTDFGDWTQHRGQFRHLESIDFSERSWVPNSGWPLDLDELLPWYERASDICGTGKLHCDLDSSGAESSSDLGLDSSRVERKVFRFGDRAQFTKLHKDTFAAHDLVTIFLHATVTDIEVDDGGSRVSAISVRSGDGADWKVEARHVVLACGGIENARVLLNADSGRSIGNGRDLVGRFFMEHPTATTGFWMPSGRHLEDRMAPYMLHQDSQGHLSRVYLALSDALVREERLLRYTVSLWPVEPEPGWMPDDLASLAVRQRSRSQPDDPPQLYAISVMSEQAPNPASRVVLSGESGPDGLPLVNLDWQLSEIDLRTLIRAQQIIQEEFQLAGLGHVFTRRYSDVNGGFLSPMWDGYPARLDGMHHHMGTTRMHEEASLGVVDSNCRVHGMQNLFIAGSSVFPTSGFANPTLTIVALAARLARHLRHNAQIQA